MKSVCLDTQYLVLSGQVLVAHDVAQMLAGYNARATVHLPRTIAEALAVIDRLAHLSLAFVQLDACHQGASAQARSELSRRIAARGGQMVLIGADRNAVPGESWIPLPVPFSTDAVLHLLDNLLAA